METKFYVVKELKVLMPQIVEKFDNMADAASYAALMSRAKKANYSVLEAKEKYEGEEKPESLNK